MRKTHQLEQPLYIQSVYVGVIVGVLVAMGAAISWFVLGGFYILLVSVLGYEGIELAFVNPPPEIAKLYMQSLSDPERVQFYFELHKRFSASAALIAGLAHWLRGRVIDVRLSTNWQKSIVVWTAAIWFGSAAAEGLAYTLAGVHADLFVQTELYTKLWSDLVISYLVNFYYVTIPLFAAIVWVLFADTKELMTELLHRTD